MRCQVYIPLHTPTARLQTGWRIGLCCLALADTAFPVLFALHTFYLFSETLASFHKYADDVVIGHPWRDAQGLSIINNALNCVSEWSGKNGLNLSPNKCVRCTLSLKRNSVTDHYLKVAIIGNVLFMVDSVTYLGITFARNAKWTNHVERIFRKCVRLSFFAKKLRRSSTPVEFIRKFYRGVRNT